MSFQITFGLGNVFNEGAELDGAVPGAATTFGAVTTPIINNADSAANGAAIRIRRIISPIVVVRDVQCNWEDEYRRQVIISGAWNQLPPAATLELASEVKGKQITLKAPIDSADLTIDDAGTVLTMSIGLDRVKSGNFLLDIGLGGFLSSYGAKELMYVGSGPSGGEPVRVGGVATSGRIAVDLELDLAVAAAQGTNVLLDVSGTAVFDDVEVPIPGIGKLSDLTLQVRAQITLAPVG